MRLRLADAVAGVFATSFALSVFFAAPGLTWYDAGELTLAAGSMGVAHPPGEPAWLVLGQLVALVPCGELAFRLTLLSGLCIAGAASALAWAVGLAARRSGLNDAMAALSAGLLFACAPAAMIQGVRPELYGLWALLGGLAVAALQAGGRRGLALAVLPCCVAGAVHHALLVAAIPALSLLALGRGRGSLLAAWGAALLLLGPGLGQFAWLPLRSAADPAIDLIHPEGLRDVLFAVSGQAYARSFRLSEGQLFSNMLAHGRLFAEDLGWMGLLLAAVGAAVSGSARATGAGLLAVAVGVLPTALQGVFNPENPDARGYLLAPVAAMAMGAGFGLAWLLERVRSRSANVGRALIGPALVALMSVPLTSSARLADRRGLRGPEVLANAALEAAPAGALLLVGGDSWILPLLHERYWGGRRADVEVVPLHQLSGAHLASLARRGAADVPALQGAGFPESRLRQLDPSGRRPLCLNDLFVPPELLERRQPRGPLVCLDGHGEPALEERLWTAWLKPWRASSSVDATGPGVWSRRYGSRGGLHRTRGEGQLAARAFERGSLLASKPTSMIHLMRYRWEQGADRAGTGGLPSGLWREQLGRSDDTALALLEDTGGPDAAAARGALQLMRGDLRAAGEQAGLALAAEPTHPVALLVAERLFYLGHPVGSSR